MLEWIPFVSSYPIWVRVFFLVWLALGIGVFVFSPRLPVLKEETPKNAQGVQMNQSAGDLKATQVSAETINIFQSSPSQEQQKETAEPDDLLVSIPTPIGVQGQDKLFTDIVFINNGRRDATVVLLTYGIGPTDSPMPHWKCAWDQLAPEVIPAKKTLTKRFEFPSSFLDNLRKDYGTPKKHDVALTCRILDANGSPHLVHRSIGILVLTENDWSILRDEKGSPELRLLPSKISGTRMTQGVMTVGTNPTAINMAMDTQE